MTSTVRFCDQPGHRGRGVPTAGRFIADRPACEDCIRVYWILRESRDSERHPSPRDESWVRKFNEEQSR